MKEQGNMKLNGQWMKLIQMQHPEKLLKFTRQLHEETLTALYGIENVETYISLKNMLHQQAKEAADQLLEDPAFADRVDHLPFKKGETVIGIGESTTDDLLSWFEIMRYMLERRRPHNGIHLINEGISGSTSTQLLGRMGGIVARKPDWILCMIGGNDVLRFGPEPSITQVSVEETARNLTEIRRLSTVGSDARWVWITPTTIDEKKVASFPHFKQAQISCRNDDIVLVGDIIRSQSDPVVDTQAGFRLPGSSEWMGPDGMHPTIAGHQAILTWLIEELTGGK